MEKYFILSAAVLLTLASCSKQVPAEEEQREISFQVVSALQTRADSSKPGEFTNEDFGAYAWHTLEDGSREPVKFFQNQRVAKVGDVWRTTNHTYYWPKTGGLDFISYSPYDEGSPSVTINTISWSNYTVKDQNQKDLMYADAALNQTGNGDAYYKNGVPALFHHALAKLSFKVKATFLEYIDYPKYVAKWEVTLKSAKLSGIYNTGDLTLTMAADGKWPLPEVGEAKAHVWANPSGAMEDTELLTAKDESGAASLKLTTAAQDLYDGKSFFVLPQALAAKAQTLTLSLHITTIYTDGEVTENDYSNTFDLLNVSDLTAWQMNQDIIYTISIKPTSSIGPADDVITFDPALSDWETHNTDAIIQINI